jgi:hypothetical protein
VRRHLEDLRDTASYRLKHQSAIVRGPKFIRTLIDNGIEIKKLGVVAPYKWWHPDEIRQPAIGVLENPENWPATEYFVVAEGIASRFLGREQSAANEVWAEVSTNIKAMENADKSKIRRVLIMDRPDKDIQVGELIRTARMLAFDVGMLCDSEGVDLFGMRILKVSQLQTFFFPIEKLPRVQTAVAKAELMGCTPIYVRLLPESEISRSQVGVPQFWRKNGRNVDVSEVQGKVALVISGNPKLRIEDDDICVSIPLAVSPLGPRELSSLSINNAATLAMTTVVGLDKEYGLRKPKVLEPTRIDEDEVHVVAERLIQRMEDGREKTAQQQELWAKKDRERKLFEADWMDQEIGMGVRAESHKGWVREYRNIQRGG